MGKYLGQHFLINKNKLRKIVEALDLKAGDVVIEIGPGHGELTREIIAKLQNCKIKKLIAIEKDEKLTRDLRNKIYDLGLKNIEIIEGDVLKILPQIINSIVGTSDVPTIKNNFRTSDVQKLKLVGNIPYYITGHLFRIIGDLKNKPSLIVLTVQKEVAERVCALRQAQGKPKMNLLAASIQFWAEPKIIGSVSKKDFRPQPSVDSAIIKLKTADTFTCESRLEKERGMREEKRYYSLIKILFKQPRKTILNNLISGFKNKKREEITDKLTKLKINPQDRPQNLKIEQICQLSTLFEGLL